MLDTGKDAIDVTATVTAQVATKGIPWLVEAVLKILNKLLETLGNIIKNQTEKSGKKKIETLMRNGDPLSYQKMPRLERVDLKELNRQAKELGFQYSINKSGQIMYKAKDAEVVALAFENVREKALANGKVIPEMDLREMRDEVSKMRGELEQMKAKAAKNAGKEYTQKTAKSQYEAITVTRDKEGAFVYSRGNVSMTSKNEKSDKVRQRLQDTFGIGEKSAWAVWNQGLDLSKNEKVANRSSIKDNISKAQAKRQADIKAAKQAPKAMAQATQKATPAAGIAR